MSTVFPRINARGVYFKIRDFRGRSFEGGRLFQNFKNSGTGYGCTKVRKHSCPVINVICTAKSRSHCRILDREPNYMKTKYSHFEIEHELSEERILMPYVTSSK